MSRTFTLILLALVLTLFVPRQVHACVCEMAWEQTVTDTWQGKSLVQDQIDGLGCLHLRYLRNVTYARHGYGFTPPWLVRQFEADPRYIVDAYIVDATVEGMMTPADHQNVSLIVESETSRDCTTWWREHEVEVMDWIVAPVASGSQGTIMTIEPIQGHTVVEVPIVGNKVHFRRDKK